MVGLHISGSMVARLLTIILLDHNKFRQVLLIRLHVFVALFSSSGRQCAGGGSIECHLSALFFFRGLVLLPSRLHLVLLARTARAHQRASDRRMLVSLVVEWAPAS